MKEKGYKPFTADKTKKAKIRKMILTARKKMSLIRENCAKKIAKRIAAMMK
jgi:hypothetical protein